MSRLIAAANPRPFRDGKIRHCDMIYCQRICLLILTEEMVSQLDYLEESDGWRLIR